MASSNMKPFTMESNINFNDVLDNDHKSDSDDDDQGPGAGAIATAIA